MLWQCETAWVWNNIIKLALPDCQDRLDPHASANKRAAEPPAEFDVAGFSSQPHCGARLLKGMSGPLQSLQTVNGDLIDLQGKSFTSPPGKLGS